MNNKITKSKNLGVFALVMINIIAVDNVRSLPFSATYGFSLVFYYLIAAIIFFIPIALVAAELATGWPNRGGIYVWVREAFGEWWAFFIIWLQWIYNVVWYPTILSFIAAELAYLVNPHLAESKVYMLSMILLLFWSATLINCLGMKVSGVVSAIGAVIGVLLPILLIICLGLAWLILGKHSQIELSIQSFLPSNLDINNLVFLVAVLFGLIGVEMSAVHANEVDNPGRAFPRAILISTIIIFFTLVLSSLSIAIVIPAQKINVVTGLSQAFALFFSAWHMEWMNPIMVVLIVIGAIAGVAAWIIGPSKGLLVAAKDGHAPTLLSYENKYGVPVVILILQGLIVTALCSIFLLMPNVNSSYWILTVMTAQLALLVYLALFAAAIYLRYKKPAVPRAYRIPGGNIGIWIVCLLGIFASLGAIILGFFPPAQLATGNIIHYETILATGSIVLCLPPLVIYFLHMFNNKTAAISADVSPSGILKREKGDSVS